MLAIVLNHIDCVSVLLDHGANANTETDGWSGKFLSAVLSSID